MRAKKTDPAGHFSSSPINFAAGLKDHLLIIHGLQDDVVPVKTSIVLAEKLMEAGADFDFAFADGATHNWAGKPHHAAHLFRKLLQHFERFL